MSLTTNLIEYWTLDSTLNGSLGSINLGQTGSSAGYETGIIGNAMRYNGATGVFNTISHTSALAAGTVNLWFYRIGNGSGPFWRIFCKTQVGVTDALLFGTTNQGRRLQVMIADTSIYVEGVDQFSDTTWYMLTLTWDGSNIITYVNASSVNNTASAVTVAANAQPYTIGGWSGNTSQQSNCRIDEVGFWSRALSGAEISQLYNAGAGIQYPFSGSSFTPAPLMHHMAISGGLM